MVTEHGDDLVGPVQLEQIYVERTIESQLAGELKDDGDHTPILVVGEPGTGKTSLLWHLHATLRASGSYEPWLIKASTVAQLDLVRVEEAIDDARGAGLIPVLLLDTVDLLLHTERERDTLIELVVAAKERRCRVILACRPREALVLPTELRGKPRPRLGDYDDDELARAIDLHVRRFYARAHVRAREEHHARLTRLVALRHTLREICVRPLTLRMLFELYAPEEVPPEIDVVGLYTAFWRDRVQSDRRAGMRTDPPGACDLGDAAGRLAIAMLAEGRIGLSRRRAEQVLRDDGLPTEQVEDLIRRGVLHTSEGAVEFFHQTFFEHAAARGIVDSLRGLGFDLLRQRVESRPDDLLSAAVLEQALLVAGSYEPTVRSAAQRVFERLLASPHPTQSSAAVAVYARVPSASPETIAAAARAMRSHVVADRFLATVASMPEHRTAEAFAQMAAIWTRAIDGLDQTGQWGNCEHLLDELPRFAMREAAAPCVRAFLDVFRVLETVSRMGPGSTGRRKLLVVLSALAPHDRAKVWEELVQLARGVPGHPPTHELTDVLVRAVARQAPVLGRKRLATELEAEVALEPKRFTAEVSRALGELWVAEWRLGGASMAEVLSALGETRDLRRFRGRLNGLREFLRTQRPENIDVAWGAFLAETERQRRAEWVRVVWQELLMVPPAGDAPRANVVEEAGRRIAAVLAAPASEDPDGVRRQLLRAVRDAGCPGATAMPLLDDARTADPSRWLTMEDLGPLLPFAYMRAHPAAVDAMHRTIARDRGSDRQVAALAVTALVPHIATNSKAADAFFRLAAMMRDAGSVLQALAAGTSALDALLAEHAASLSTIADALMASHREIERRSGTRLHIELVRRGAVPRPTADRIATLSRQLGREGDRPTRGWLATLLGEAGEDGVEPAMRVLLECVRAEAFERARAMKPELPGTTGVSTEDVAEKAFAAIIHLAKAHGTVARWAFEIVKLLQYMPVNSGIVRQLGWLVMDLSERHVDTATTLVEKLVTSMHVARLGRAGQRVLRATLRKPMRAWMAAAGPADRARMLAMSHLLAPDLACLLIDAASREVFVAVEGQLRDLLVDARLPEEVREYVGHQLALRGDIDRGEEWPELAEATRTIRARAGYDGSLLVTHQTTPVRRPARGERMTTFQFPKGVIDAYKNDELAIFVGSGLSTAPDVVGGFPRWHELPSRLLEAGISLGDIDDDFNRAFQLLFPAAPKPQKHRSLEVLLAALDLLRAHLVEQRLYQDVLNAVFRPDIFAPGDAHLAIYELNAPLVITTNYDLLLERALRAGNYTTYTWREANSALGDIEKKRPVLFKVHGTVERADTVIMTMREYDDIQGSERYVEVLRHILQQRTFLFVGFGMNDPHDLDLLLQRNARVFKQQGRVHYALVKDPDAAWRDRLNRELGVKVVEYYDYAKLPAILRDLRTLKP
ncbi:SIR2 family protein [Sorangium sp. So ce861]|uniref:SIR2 family protein n=1 Tax=Sorangium sp. So ce861 TaxID=3133323 RepID=UPI003F645D49